MKKILLVAILFVTMSSSAQLGIGTTSPASSSILDISSTEKGFLLPRMTNSQKNSIATPTAGLWIWCSDCGASGEMQVYNGVSWTTLSDDVAPSSLAYTGSPFIFTKGTTISPIATPTYLGGTVSYTISPSLPSGLVFNSVTGAITGTPTIIQSATTHTITATNTGGSTTATISITVNDIAPFALAYTGSPYTYTIYSAITPIASPTNSGGTPTSYSISPSLPSGLVLNTATGGITGTPTAASSATTYTVTASNGFGSTTTTISIRVNNIAPTALAYTGSPFTYAKGMTIPIASPTNSGGTVDSYSVSPALPTGMSLNTVTGAITGTPTAIQNATTYTITAVNTISSTTTTISIAVDNIVLDKLGLTSSTLPTAAYSLRKLSTRYTGSAIRVRRSSDNTEQNIGFDGSDNLDTTALLNFTTNNGAVPTASAFVVTWYDQSGNGKNTTQATLTAQPNIVLNGSVQTTNSRPTVIFQNTTQHLAGSSSITVMSINAVRDVKNYPASGGSRGLFSMPHNGDGAQIRIKTGLSYYGSGTFPIYNTTDFMYDGSSGASTNTNLYINGVYTRDTQSALHTLTAYSPVATRIENTFTISNNFSGRGMANNDAVGELLLFPNVISATERNTIEQNQGGYYSIQLLPSNLTYTGSPFIYTKGTAITAIAVPTTSGGTPTSYSVSPALPVGLTLNASTGAISGTPTAIQTATTYTITASNTVGSTTTTLSITVNDAAPSGLTYIGSPFTFDKGTAITPIAAPSSSGGTVVSYAISPALPSGLTLNTSTGAITGTPTIGAFSTTYTVTASNTGGSTTATISITVNDSTPSGLTYIGSPFTYTNGTAITPVAAPTNSGGTPISYSINPALPTGLVLNTTTGAITGTPTAIQSATTHTITAANTGGSTTTAISITVNDAPPSGLTYTGSPFTYTKGTAIVTLVPTNTGGTPTSYAVSPTLPAGLSLNTTTGTISGTPTVIQTTTTHTITATNAVGSTTTTVDITVNDVAPSALVYTGSPFTYTRNTAITSATPTNSGGAPTSYLVSPTLPSGLSLNTATGAITGTPTVVSAATNYTITATNTGGSTTATINITVTVAETLNLLGLTSSDPKSSGAYSLRKLRTNYMGNAVLVRRSSDNSTQGIGFDGSGNLDTTALVNFATNNGAVPTANAFVVTWYDQSGFDNHVTNATAAKQPQIVNSGSVITRSSKPVVYLPSGAGAYLQNTAATVGVPNSMVNIGGIDALSGSNLVMSAVGTSNGNAIRINNGGNIQGVKIGQALVITNSYVSSAMTLNSVSMIQPTGSTATTIFFNGATIPITGGATSGVGAPSSTITIGSPGDFGDSSSNSFMSESIFFSSVLSTTNRSTIETNQSNFYLTPSISYPASNAFSLGISNSISPTLLGGPITSYAISPSLPAGLSLNATTGVISGTPTAASNATTYTVTASNFIGSSTATFTISVFDFTLDKLGYTSSDPKASAAYSLRKLRTDYTGNAVLVRRSSDNTTQAIGFDGSGNLDTTALVGFAGSSDAFVVTWYDQSGLDNHVTNFTAAKQPQIVRNGSVITKSGKPVIYFPQDEGRSLRNTTAVVGVPNSMINVGGIDNLFYASLVMSHVGMSNGNAIYIVNGSGITATKVGVVDIGTNSFATEKVLNIVSMVQPTGATATSIFLNGNEATITSGATASIATPSPGIAIGARGDNGASSGNSFISESILFPSVLSTPNRSTIENNQYGYYLTPSISYPATNTVSLGTNNTISPTLLGGPITSFAISPSLPSGLSLNSTTGVISGTPSAVSNGSYTVTATNTAGSATATFTIEVVDITLDQLGFNSSDAKATAAYSLRKLSTAYTGDAILVRRSSDDATQAIGFDGSGNLDVSALTAFAGSTNAFVVTWYDQSGLDNHVTQTVTANQPRIVNAGLVETLNGKPAVYLNNAYLTGNTSAFAYPNTINGVVGTNSSTATGVLLAIGENDGPGIGLGNYVGVGSTNYNITGIKGSVAYMPTASTLALNTSAIMTMNTLSGGSASVLKLNGTPLTITDGATAPPVAPTSKINIGSNASVSGPTIMINSYVQEGVFFNTTLSSTQLQTLESNQNVYYAAAPSALSYTGSPFTYTVGTAITPIAAPINSGGAPTSYSISPALPAGLSLSVTTGAITGTPTVTSAATTYTITATNGFGSTTATLDITVN